jgi:hypothetical protein
MTMQTPPLYLVEMTVYDPALGVSGGTKVLRFASSGYVTSPTAAPANTYYDARIIQAIDATRTLFNGGATASTPDVSQDEAAITLGDLMLANGDGALDDLIGYAIDGQSIVEYRSTVLNPQYPADFVKCFVGTMLAAEFATDTITVQMRDMTQPLALPLQTNKYLGNNVLPNGLEGVATDLLGKEKPLVFGSVTNISPPCVNTDKLIYQVSDGAIASMDAVYDKGSPLVTGFPAVAGTGLSNVVRYYYLNGLHIALGGNVSGAIVYHSVDGVTWAGQILPAPFAFLTVGAWALAWSPGPALYCVVGDQGTVATSPDLITWTVRAAPFGTHQILAIVNGNGVLVAASAGASAATNITATSTDGGVTWTTHANAAFAGDSIYDLAYNVALGQFLMVGITSSGGAAQMASSPDGAAWSAVAQPFTGGEHGYRVNVLNGLFFVGTNTATIAVTPDLLNWNYRSAFGITNQASGFALGNGFYVALFDSGKLATSFDAVNWQVIPSGLPTTLQVAGVSFVGSTFFIGTFNGMYTSAGQSAYASLADLQDDTKAPAKGTFKYYSSSAGSYFRLGSPPGGTPTADVTQGAAPANRTAAQLFTQLLTRAGYSAANWSAADVTALDVAAPYVLDGYYDSATTYIVVLDAIAASVGAWWGPDQFGIFRIQQLTAPVAPAVISFGVNDVVKPITIGVSTGGSNNTGAASTVDGLPVYRCTVNWGQSYTVQTTDLATGVSAARRAVVAQQWRTAQASDLTVITGDPLASETIEDSMLTTAADAQAEASRRLALRKVQRRPFEVTVPFTPETAVVDLGTVIEVVTPRYGLQAAQSDGAGALLRVLGVAANAKDNTLAITAWGRGQAARNLIADDGDFLASDDGVYLVSAVEN